MITRSLRRSAVALAGATTLGTAALSGGCVATEYGELETFARDLLLSALAAFLL